MFQMMLLLQRKIYYDLYDYVERNKIEIHFW